jgi:hypothetical protein
VLLLRVILLCCCCVSCWCAAVVCHAGVLLLRVMLLCMWHFPVAANTWVLLCLEPCAWNRVLKPYLSTMWQGP